MPERTIDDLRARLARAEQFLAVERADRERMLAELQLAHRLEAVGQLAAGVAHEINTPTQYCMDNARFLQEAFREMRAVLRAYEVLATTVRDGGDLEAAMTAVGSARDAADLEFLLEDVPSALDQSIEGLRQVAGIVRALKDFSHPGSDDALPVDLGPLIETSVVLSRGEHKHVADVVVEIDPGLPPVPCQEGKVKQVLLNLLVNAAHAVQAQGGSRGRITVRARALPEVVRVEVEDTGAGIPAAIRDRVFDLFFTTKEVGVGTGQGLALAHRVVSEEHGGRLGFDSEEGVGTTFWFELPRRAAEAAA